jgi:endonuclease IV
MHAYEEGIIPDKRINVHGPYLKNMSMNNTSIAAKN